MSFTVEQMQTRDAWLSRRLRGVTASESAALFDQSPFLQRWELYQRKLGQLGETPDNERMYWGRRLESIIAEEVTVRYGWPLIDHGRFAVCQSTRWPFMLASLDREAIHPQRGRGVIDCKNSDAFMRDKWDEDGIPLYIQIQMQHQLAVCGYEWGGVAVLLGGNEWRLIEFPRDEGFIDLLVGKCSDFWGCIQRGEEPPVDASDGCTSGLKYMFRRDDGNSIMLPAEAQDWDAKIAAAQDAQKVALEVEELHKNKLRQAIGEASYGVLPDESARWSFKATKGRENKTLKRVDMPKFKPSKAA